MFMERATHPSYRYCEAALAENSISCSYLVCHSNTMSPL